MSKVKIVENRSLKGRGRKIKIDTALTVQEARFLDAYMETMNMVEAAKRAGYSGNDNKLRNTANRILNRPNVAYELQQRNKRLMKKSIAHADEVMEYLTSVMRGEVKDQFGLDAPLAERTKAAQELAKRTIDVENRAQGKADNVLQINLNWERD